MNEDQPIAPADAEHDPQDGGQGLSNEQQASLETLGLDSEAVDEDSELDPEDFLDLDELMNTLRSVHDLLEKQSREIQGLRREMRELRESQGAGGRGGGAPRGGGRSWDRDDRPDRGSDRGEYRREFRPREERRPYEGGGERREFRPRQDEGYRPRPPRDRDGGERQGGDRFGRSGGSSGPRERQDFRPSRGREERSFDRDRSGGGNRDGGARPEGGAFRPRARRDHGWRDDD